LEIRKKIDLSVLASALRLKSSLEQLHEAPALDKGKTRPEIHFSGSLLGELLGPSNWLQPVKAENDIPDFLKLEDHAAKAKQKISTDQSSDHEDSLMSACLYSEMALKNARYAPQFPLRATEASAQGQSSRQKSDGLSKGGRMELEDDELEVEQRVSKATEIEFLQPRSVSVINLNDSEVLPA